MLKCSITPQQHVFTIQTMFTEASKLMKIVGNCISYFSYIPLLLSISKTYF